MSLLRCSVCHKAGLDEDFIFVPVDETHEQLYCYDCAPPEAMKQTWPVDEDSYANDNENDAD